MATKKVKTAISVDPELWGRLDRLAKAAKRSRSAMLEQILRDGLDDAETAIKAFTDPVILQAFGQVFGDRSVLKAMASAVKDEMQDGQLDLFVRGLEGLSQVAADAGLSPPAGLERPEGLAPAKAVESGSGRRGRRSERTKGVEASRRRRR